MTTVIDSPINPRQMLDDGERAFVLHWVEGLTWSEVGEQEGIRGRAAKSRSWRWEQAHPAEAAAYKGDHNKAPQVVRTEGVRAGEGETLDEDAVYERACQLWEHTQRLKERRVNQRIEFDHGPVALVEVADVHMGDMGVDYPRAFEEAELIAQTPGMYAVFAGDIVNQFVIGKLRQARDESSISIPEEWVLVRRYLRILAPKLLVVVGGNHDHWAKLLTGVDYFREVTASIREDVIYDADDVLITVQVGDWEIPTRIRHRWKGSSIYNPTHGLERSVKFDQRFLIGMGAHTHASGLTRSFNVEGRTGIAMLAGSYKRVDGFARRKGFPAPNQSTAVTVVIDDEERSLTGFDNLESAARYMSLLYR